MNAAVLAIAAFGVLCVTREYRTGMIKTTFLAQPSRLPMVICIWGVALGAMLRSSSSAIIWLASVLVVAPVIVQILPRHLVELIGRWLPSQIGQQAIAAHPSAHSFSPWIGLAVLSAYAGLTLLAGAWRITHTDP